MDNVGYIIRPVLPNRVFEQRLEHFKKSGILRHPVHKVLLFDGGCVGKWDVCMRGEPISDLGYYHSTLLSPSQGQLKTSAHPPVKIQKHNINNYIFEAT